MAAGCVPVVINKGAQPEIVEHGKHKGTAWKDMHRNTLEWYRDNLQSGPLKNCAIAELARRDGIDEF